MMQFQKIINLLATAFALFLAVLIFGTLFTGVTVIGGLIDKNSKEIKVEGVSALSITGNKYKVLDMKIASSNVVIKEDNSFKVETNNKLVSVKEDATTLGIYEDDQLISDTDNIIVIYVPKNYSFDEVSIESGAAKIEIEKLNTKKMELDIGAGEILFKKLIVLDDIDIEGGVGSIKIKNGEINNLDLEMGIGKTTIKAKLTGNNYISCGISDNKITLIGDENDYKIKTKKVFGEVILDNIIVDNDKYYGEGNTNIFVESSVGNSVIKYTE